MSTDLELREAIDHLDAGLPGAPDLTGIMAAGRVRRRRSQTTMVVVGLATAAAVVPLALALVDPGADVDPATVDRSATQHGEAVRTAVSTAFPSAKLVSEVMLDSWGEDDQGSTAGLSDPIRWDTLFSWRQEYSVAGLDKLTVDSDRLAPDDRTGLDPVCVNASPRQASCEEEVIGERLVVVEDGLPAGDQWLRVVEVYAQSSDSGSRSRVTVAATAAGETWEMAEQSLPSVSKLTGLALDERLVLPEPDRYPEKP